MDVQFRRLEEAIESQPMPPEFQDMKALIHCNDCHAKSSVKYHWLGLKCSVLPEVVAPSRAATFSAPPSSEPLAADGSERRCVRSQDPNATSRLPHSPTLVTTSVDGSATESEADEEDLDFWGQRSPVIRAVTTGPQEESMSSDSEVDDESQDESDEDAVIYDDDDGGTDDSEADGEEEDLMEIYGHR
ncbi:MAG: hypothetical protein L6R37_004246 [Teloschistes peruensis]|nr:MAG: hypothetical protein L6R37_004246 [Teloschistes peruensis]